jgi:DnaJ-class molecular chaperone
MNDYYDILGVSRTANSLEIKTAYKKLASMYHPDKNSDPRAKEFFVLIKEAYATLGNEKKREAYDKPAYDAMLKHIFANGPVYKRVHDVYITLEDAYNGCKRPLGDITAEIPPGVLNKSRMALGDTLYNVNVIKHDVFKRNRDDLLVDVTITNVEALLGKTVDIYHLSGEKISVTLNETFTGDLVMIAGKGMPNQLSGEYGDLYVKVTVTPVEKNTLTKPLIDAIIDAYGKKILEPRVINEPRNQRNT